MHPTAGPAAERSAWGRTLRSCRLPALTTICLLFAAAPARERYEWQEWGWERNTALVRERDVAFAEGRFPDITDDGASYLAIASGDPAASYVARRNPFAYRLAGPLLVRSLNWALSPLSGFLILAAVGHFAAAVALWWVSREYGATEHAADAGALLFALAPKVVTPLMAPLVVDAGAWALMFWAWYAWLRNRPLISMSTLAAGLFWRETAVLIVPCMIHEGMAGGRPRRLLASVAALAIVVLAVPRLLISPSNIIPPAILGSALAQTKLADLGSLRGALSVFLEYTIYGLGLALVPALFGWRHGQPRDRALLWLIPGCVAVTLTAFEVGRHMVPAILALTPMALRGLQRDESPWAGRLAVVGGAGLAISWLGGRGAAHVGVAFSLGLAVWLALTARGRRDP